MEQLGLFGIAALGKTDDLSDPRPRLPLWFCVVLSAIAFGPPKMRWCSRLYAFVPPKMRWCRRLVGSRALVKNPKPVPGFAIPRRGEPGCEGRG